MKISVDQKDNIIREKSFNFALEAIKIQKLLVAKKQFSMSQQFFKSATSIGANVEESLAAHSRKDFIAKMVIAAKEARETRYWLMLMKKSSILDISLNTYLNEIESIMNILFAIIKSSKEQNNFKS